MSLQAGTYLITVPEGCRIMEPDWSLSGLVSRIGNISVKALRVKAPENLNITGIVSSEAVVGLLDQPRFNKMVPVAKLHLEKTPLADYIFPWEM